ncbi:MAG: hypothetical protein HC829_08965 [Bacteroidales bacterium]|nr:hypothetical protein [Bacteroidales bacterium]
MTEHVWVSDLMGSEADIIAEVRGTFGPEGRAVDGAQIIVSGQPAPSGYGPIKLWDCDSSNEDQHSGYPVNIAQHVPDIFQACGFWVISERVAGILQRFDLGAGAVFPLSDGLYLKDEVTKIPGERYSWWWALRRPHTIPKIQLMCGNTKLRGFGIRCHMPLLMATSRYRAQRSMGPMLGLMTACLSRCS